MVFHQFWPNNRNAPGSTTSGGFMEVNDYLIWCSTAHKVAGFSTIFTELEDCTMVLFEPKLLNQVGGHLVKNDFKS